MIKLVATDIDGTLVNDDLKISSLNKKALKLAIDKDIKVVFCSGRAVSSLLNLVDEFNIINDDEYVVGYNGAMGTNILTKETVFKESLNGKEVKRIARIAEKLDIDYSIHLIDQIITGKMNYYSYYEAKINNIPLKIRSIDDIDDNAIVLKIIILGEKNELEKSMDKLPQYIYDDYTTLRSTTNYFEIVKKDINKYTGIMKIAKMLNIKNDEILGIGDELNDLDLVKNVGIGVAMDNANPILIKEADFKTKSNNESGVAFALNKFLKLNMKEFK